MAPKFDLAYWLLCAAIAVVAWIFGPRIKGRVLRKKNGRLLYHVKVIYLLAFVFSSIGILEALEYAFHWQKGFLHDFVMNAFIGFVIGRIAVPRAIVLSKVGVEEVRRYRRAKRWIRYREIISVQQVDKDVIDVAGSNGITIRHTFMHVDAEGFLLELEKKIPAASRGGIFYRK